MVEQSVFFQKTDKNPKRDDHLYLSVNKIVPTDDMGTDTNFKQTILWKYVFVNALLHIGGFYGIYLMFYARFLTNIWATFLWVCAVEGITMGAHRLYAHRAYKATALLKVILIILQTVSGQFSLYTWVREHRIHHRFTDTDADPHNANRGFFFSHYGWLMVKKHPLVFTKGRTVDLSDLEADKFVMFQKNHFQIIYLIFGILIPVMMPIYAWNETWKNSFFIAYMARNVASSHSIASVNSFAHYFGTKPFDKRIRSTQTKFVSVISVGEGWHNYHHSFPWDYKAAELGSDFNLTAFLIEIAARLGLAYDLRTAPDSVIQARAKNYGDGSYGKHLPN